MADDGAAGRLIRLEVENFKSYRGQQVRHCTEMASSQTQGHLQVGRCDIDIVAKSPVGTSLRKFDRPTVSRASACFPQLGCLHLAILWQ